jgi:hypothetical protein
MTLTDSTRRTIRTVVQVVVSLAFALPVVLPALGVPTTMAGYGTILGVAAVITHIMAEPRMQRWLPAWLRTAVPAAAPEQPGPGDPASPAALRLVDGTGEDRTA